MLKMRNLLALVATALLIGAIMPASAQDAKPGELPDPDGKPADMSKPVKVFILMGQSNMLEMGKVAGDTDGAGFFVRAAQPQPVQSDLRGRSAVGLFEDQAHRMPAHDLACERQVELCRGPRVMHGPLFKVRCVDLADG